MNCHCGEKAFTFTRISSRDGKKYTSLVGRCNRSLEESNKKKKKCDFTGEEVIEICDLVCEEIKPELVTVSKKYLKTREDHIGDLFDKINTIKMCQDKDHPYDKHTNFILYLSKKLNIPPYIPEKYTIEEYYKIAKYYLKKPPSVHEMVSLEKYSLTDDFLETIKNGDHPKEYKWNSHKRPKHFYEATNEELYEHFKKILTIEKTMIKVKLQNRVKHKIVSNINGEFKTGGIDDENMEQEDELDIEEFESEEEQDDYDDYKSD
jgi:hypothetical protein